MESVEEDDSDVTIVHKILRFCARWGRECIENLRVLCLTGMGVYRESSGFVLDGDGDVLRTSGFCAWRDGTAAVQSPGGYDTPRCGGLCAGALLPGRPLPAEGREGCFVWVAAWLGRELSPVRGRPKSRPRPRITPRQDCDIGLIFRLLCGYPRPKCHGRRSRGASSYPRSGRGEPLG